MIEVKVLVMFWRVVNILFIFLFWHIKYSWYISRVTPKQWEINKTEKRKKGENTQFKKKGKKKE